MPARVQLSVEEFLNRSFRPDCDYVDGELRGGTRETKSRINATGGEAWLRARRQSLRIVPMTEVRLRIGPTRFRIPDIMVVSADAPNEEVVVHASPALH